MENKKELEKITLEKFKTFETVDLRKVVGGTNTCSTSGTATTYVTPSTDTVSNPDTMSDCGYT